MPEGHCVGTVFSTSRENATVLVCFSFVSFKFQMSSCVMVEDDLNSSTNVTETCSKRISSNELIFLVGAKFYGVGVVNIQHSLQVRCIIGVGNLGW